MAETILINNPYAHPLYNESFEEWFKYRLVFEGGISYVNEYLYKFSDAEEQSDFDRRKKVTYRPNHAKRAILKIRDAVFQRMVDVKREGGPQSYIDAVSGAKGGVNRRGMSISAYLGLIILPELLSMGRAFVYVDKSPLTASYQGKITVADAQGKVPYLSLFRTEDVLTWVPGDPDSPHEYTSVLLREWRYKMDEKTGMPSGQSQRYRKLFVERDKVYAQYYDDKMIADPVVVPLGIDRIPLVKFEVCESLMVDIADYQIALLNLVSADMQYLLNANTGVYVEQFDPKWEAQYTRQANPTETASTVIKDSNGNVIVPQGGQTGLGTDVEASRSVNQKIKLGYKFARRVPTGTLMPEFIHPSTDPVVASMKKQEQLIEEIERLVNIKVGNLSITGEAKKQDRSDLESGLSTIGLVLQTGENHLAQYWAKYEGADAAKVSYPTDYSLKTDGDRIKDANDLIELKTAVPSPTFAKEVSKKIARTMFDGRATPEKLKEMENDIETAEFTTSDPQTLATAHQEGAITAVMMAKALGFKNPEKLAAAAQAEQADRLATIAIHQQKAAGARGVSDMQHTAHDGTQEKQIAQQQPTMDKSSKSQAP